jgi:hypothetical protein
MFLANSLGGAERRGNLLEHPQLIHAMHDCGHERQFFMANTSITARISVTPNRTSIFCFRLSSPRCRSISVADSKRSDREKQSDRRYPDQQSEQLAMLCLTLIVEFSLNPPTKKPRPRPGLLIRRSLGEISTSQQPVHSS